MAYNRPIVVEADIVPNLEHYLLTRAYPLQRRFASISYR